MFDFSTEDLPSYIPGYEEWLEDNQQDDTYIVDERELGEKEYLEEKKEREEEEENEQKREKTI